MKKHKKMAAIICAAAMSLTSLQGLPGKNTVPVLSVSAADANDPDLILSYTSEAGTYSTDNAFNNDESFYKALPLGNGRIGAMVYGNCPTEWIDLNESTVWSGGPGSNDRYGAADHLKEVQELLSQGKYKEANAIISSKMIGGGQAKYQKVGMLKIATGHEKPGDYSRQLDMNTGVATTSYTCGGKRYVRESFVSYPDQVMVTRITCDSAGGVSCRISYDGLLNGGVSTDGDTIIATGHGDNDVNTRGAVYYCARTKVIPEKGTLTAGQNSIDLNGADSVVLVTAIRTNFIDANTCNGDEKGDSAKDLKAVSGKSYDELYQRHIADFSEMMHRVDLDLGGDTSANASKTTDQRVKEFGTTNDPKMVELLYQYGRYLLISASRDGQPTNLQGIWNKYSAPAWGSKATTNINYEMNYWPALTTNLAECFEPFVEKAKALTVSGHETAKVQYGIDEGWVLHHNTDLWNRTGPIDGSWGMWPTGGAWISNMLYDAYEFNQDKDYLEDVYPVIQGSAAFLNKLMIPQEIDGKTYMVISPSASPELPLPGYNWDDNVYCSYSVTMDNAITRELFSDVVRAADELGADTDFRNSVSRSLSQIKPPAIGKYGQLMEWAYDWDSASETHRHISHIYGLFPGNEYSPSTNPTVSNAAKNVLERRGDLGTGWSEAWKLNCWARLEDGEHAYDLVKMLITPVNGTESGRLYTNLWDAHPPFQIDGNFGFTSGVTEMLLQSQNNELSLLPALPSAWSDGHVNGLCARGNFEVTSMKWSGSKLTDVTILSRSGNDCTVRYGGRRISFETEKGKEYHLNGRLEPKEEVNRLANIAPTGKASANLGEATAAIDGARNTSWDIPADTRSNYITVDLGKETEIRRWGMRFADNNSYAADILLQYSTDGSQWEELESVYGNTKTSFMRNISPVSAQYFRIYIKAPAGAETVKTAEFELWGENTGGAAAGISPYNVMEAEESDIMEGGIQIENNDGYSDIGYIQDGCVFGFWDVDFASGAEKFSIRASSAGEGGTVEIHLGSPDGPLAGRCAIDVTGNWADYQTYSCDVSGCTGLQDLYLVCRGEEGYLFNVDSIQFTARAVKQGDVNGDGSFTLADIVVLQRWLLSVPDTKLADWRAGDLCEDGRLDAFDLTLMREMLLAQ